MRKILQRQLHQGSCAADIWLQEGVFAIVNSARSTWRGFHMPSPKGTPCFAFDIDGVLKQGSDVRFITWYHVDRLRTWHLT